MGLVHANWRLRRWIHFPRCWRCCYDWPRPRFFLCSPEWILDGLDEAESQMKIAHCYTRLAGLNAGDKGLLVQRQDTYALLNEATEFWWTQSWNFIFFFWKMFVSIPLSSVGVCDRTSVRWSIILKLKSSSRLNSVFRSYTMGEIMLLHHLFFSL